MLPGCRLRWPLLKPCLDSAATIAAPRTSMGESFGVVVLSPQHVTLSLLPARRVISQRRPVFATCWGEVEMDRKWAVGELSRRRSNEAVGGNSCCGGTGRYDRRICANCLSRRTVSVSAAATGLRRARPAAAGSRRATCLRNALCAGALPLRRGREPLHGTMVHVRTERVSLVLDTIIAQRSSRTVSCARSLP